MIQLPPRSEILKHAFGLTPPGTSTATTASGMTPAIQPPSLPGPLDALMNNQDSIEPAFVQNAARQRQQDLRNRARADAVLARLKAGDGIPTFHPQDPTGPHFCFRDENRVLSIGSHATFLAGKEPAFVLHMHGEGLMVRQDGAWVENPGAAFFEALDAASRGAQQTFIV